MQRTINIWLHFLDTFRIFDLNDSMACKIPGANFATSYAFQKKYSFYLFLSQKIAVPIIPAKFYKFGFFSINTLYILLQIIYNKPESIIT